MRARRSPSWSRITKPTRRRSKRFVASGWGLAGHAWFETYSVLTRLPGDYCRTPRDVGRLLAHNFRASRVLGETDTAALGSELTDLGISGGSVYDALVGAAARKHGRPLLSGDARARPVYEALGVETVLIR